MSIEQSVEQNIQDHPVIWLLTVAAICFTAGMAFVVGASDFFGYKMVRTSSETAGSTTRRAEPAAQGTRPSTTGDLQSGETKAVSPAAELDHPERAPAEATEGKGQSQPMAAGGRTLIPGKVSEKGIEIERLKVETRPCEPIGQCLLCDVLLTSVDRDRQIRVIRDYRVPVTRAIDPAGAEHRVEELGFGKDLRRTASGAMENLFTQGIPSLVRLKFCSIEPSVESLSLLQLALVDLDEGNVSLTADIRDVPVQ